MLSHRPTDSRLLSSLLAVLLLLIGASTSLASNTLKLTASDGATNDNFGSAVAIDGDTIIVGAYLDDGVGGTDQGAAYVYRWNGAGWTEEAKLSASDGAASDRFGFAVAISGDTAIVGSFFDGSGTGAAYVFTRTGSVWSEQQKLTASDAASGDNFGYSASIDGDTAIVGARLDDDDGTSSGSAYIFTRTGSSWSEQQKLTALDGAASDRFGQSVSLSRETAIVGAINGDGVVANSGSAYVFTRSGSIWTQQQELTAFDGASGHGFGQSVALDNNVVLVGAFRDDHSGANSGSAYIFRFNGTNFGFESKLTASDASSGDLFGISVALEGETAVVGAYLDDGSILSADNGSAYIYTNTGTGWTPRTKLTAPDSAAGDNFGWSATISGETVVIGAWLDDDAGGAGQGSAHVFERIGPVWIGPGLEVVASDADASDFFGSSVSIDANVAIVGAYGNDDFGIDSGSVYLFSREGSVWAQFTKSLGSSAVTLDKFGTSVDISGDTTIVGAPGDNDGGLGSGSAYIFVVPSITALQEAKLTANDAQQGDAFGTSVAIDADTAIVGAPLDDNNTGQNSDSGSVYIFTRTGSTWTQQAKLSANDAAIEDRFGTAVAISGDTVIVGALRDDAGAVDQGSAYIFTRTGTTWSQQQKLTASDAGASDLFGNSVSIDADTALVGAYFNNDAGADSGSAYIYTRTVTTWTQQQKLTASDAAASDLFGFSVALSADTAIVGAPFDFGSSQGSVYVYTRSGSSWIEQQKLTAIDGTKFGFSVALDNDTAIVGDLSPDLVLSGLDRGSAHFFAGTFGYSGNQSVRNLTTGQGALSLQSAIVNATHFDSIGGTYASFWNANTINYGNRNIDVRSSAEIRQPWTSTWTIDNGRLMDAPGRFMEFFGTTNVENNGQLNTQFPGYIMNAGSMTLLSGVLQSDAIFNNNTLDSEFGVVLGTLWNNSSGSFNVNSSTQINGSFFNYGLVTLDGVLTVSGTLTNNGVIDDVTLTRAIGGNGLLAQSGLSLGTSASLLLDTVGAGAIVGGNYDNAINSNTRFDMATAELHLNGDTAQTLEAMSTDIGNDSEGLNRTLAGHFPIGTLRISGTTAANLIDTHDNDNLGQAAKEALYISNLIISAGATLNTNGCIVYYETLTNNGSVDSPLNLKQIVACNADMNSDGTVDGADLGLLLGNWGNPGTADLNGDNTTDGADLGLLLGAWGPCP